MKIIFKGTPPEERMWAGTCTCCKSKFEAQQKELKNITSSQRDGEFAKSDCIVCRKVDAVNFYPIKAQ